MGMPMSKGDYANMPYQQGLYIPQIKSWKDKIADSFVTAASSQPGTFLLGILAAIIIYVVIKKYLRGKEK